MIKSLTHIKQQTWFQRLVKEFWRHPNRLTATKVMITMAVQAIPFIFLDNPFLVVTLSLGTVAAALSERDDHPKGRIKALAITIISFAITTLSVSLLKPYPIIFGVGFIASTIVFVLIGGISERYRGISYGAILIGIYAMIGYQEEYLWYVQALYLCAGALFYGLLSLYLLYRKPWRLLEEQLATGFMALSDYLKEKAKNFPTERSEHTNRQAVLNIKVVSALEKCKEVINVYSQEVKSQQQLVPYLQRFMLLQSLHERAASGHENYEKLANKEEYTELLEGFAELLHQLSHAAKLVAENMLTGEPYTHPVSIGWIVSALEFEIEKVPQHHRQLLDLLLHNLNRSHQSLKNIDLPDKSTSIPRLGQDERTIVQRIKEQLSWNHPRLRYALRLSSCFIIGYIIIQHFHLENGEWILLTSLFVSQPTYSETRRKLLERIIGTLSGVSIGILMLQILPTESGQFLLLLASGFSFFYWRFSNYSYAVVFISIYVLANNQLTSESGGHVLIPRVLDTLIGSFLSFLTIRFLWPNWQHKQIPKLLSEALQNNTLYFNAIIHRTNHQKDDYDYRLARRLAHKSDNALTQAWQSMQVEPKKRRHLIEQAFKLTYLNHALISHLSALGALYQDHEELVLDKKVDTAISVTLNRTARRLTEEGATNIDSLKPVLMELRDMINDYSQGIERQHLRLIYNIAAVSNKLLKESDAFNPKNTADTSITKL